MSNSEIYFIASQSGVHQDITAAGRKHAQTVHSHTADQEHVDASAATPKHNRHVKDETHVWHDLKM